MVLEQVRRTLESAETYCESEGVRLPSTKREGEMPLLDRAARDPQIESLEQSIASLEKHIPRLGRELAGEKAVRRERALRITTLVLLGLTLASPLLWRFRPRDEVEHAASGFMADGRSPVSNAFDQNPATAWQLENGQLGWIEARFRSPRALRKVRLLNGINAPWNDRATERYRIELYRGDRIVGTLDGNFAYTATPIVEEKVIPGSTGPVDRVRFVALSFHQAGCGLAEMSWE